MLGIIVVICLFLGPKSKVVKRFLPNTANRAVFVAFVSALILLWTVMGISSISSGSPMEGDFDLGFAGLTGIALYRYIAVWWMKGARGGQLGTTGSEKSAKAGE
jgi:hypothetical protein